MFVYMKFNLLSPIFIVLLLPWFRVVAGWRLRRRNFAAPALVNINLVLRPKPFNSMLTSSQLWIWRGSLISSTTAAHVTAHEIAFCGTRSAFCLLLFWIPPWSILTGTIFLSARCSVLRLSVTGLLWELRAFLSCSNRLNRSRLSRIVWLLEAESFFRSFFSAVIFDALMTSSEMSGLQPLLLGVLGPNSLSSKAL